jgi:hypothetical protein
VRSMAANETDYAASEPGLTPRMSPRSAPLALGLRIRVTPHQLNGFWDGLMWVHYSAPRASGRGSTLPYSVVPMQRMGENVCRHWPSNGSHRAQRSGGQANGKRQNGSDCVRKQQPGGVDLLARSVVVAGRAAGRDPSGQDVPVARWRWLLFRPSVAARSAHSLPSTHRRAWSARSSRLFCIVALINHHRLQQAAYAQ